MLIVNHQRRGMPLKLFFTAPLLALFIFIAGSIGFIAYLSSQHAAAQFSQKLAFQITQRTNEQIALLVSEPKTIIQNAVHAFQHGMVDRDTETDIVKYLLMQMHYSPYLTFVSLGRNNGQYVAVNRDHKSGELSLLSSLNNSDLIRSRYHIQPNGEPGDVLEQLDRYDASERPWFTHAKMTGVINWYPVYQYALAEGFGVGLSAPLYDDKGQLEAVIAVDFSLSLISYYLQSLQLDTGATVFVIGPEGNIVVASKAESDDASDDMNTLIQASQSNNPLIQASATELAHFSANGMHRFEHNGQFYSLNVTEYSDQAGLSFKTVVLLPQRELLSFLNQYLYNALWMMLLAVALGAMLTLLLSRRLVKPIEALHRSADQLAIGNQVPEKLPESEIFELNGLVQSFELMAAKIAASFSQLQFKAEQDAASLYRLSMDALEHQQRTERQRSALAQLVLDDAVAKGDEQAFSRSLTQITANAIQCQRVSVWLLSAAGNEMRCIALYQEQLLPLQDYVRLKRDDYPDYFAAITQHGWICANDALTNSATREFADHYLKPQGIGAMLDAGILIAGEVAGVVCLEHVGAVREWQPDEEAFVGAVAAVLAQVISIGQQQLAEQMSKEHAEHTETILNSVVDGIITMDSEGVIISLNPAALKLFGGAALDYIGRHASTLLSAILSATDHQITQCFPSASHQPVLGVLTEIEAVRADGSDMAIALALSAVTRQEQLVYIATVRDISEHKRLARLKNEFVSTVSHELRTPLTSITGAIGLVKSGKLGELSEKASHLMTVAYKNCQNLTLLVNDLLDFEKISAGKMTYEMQNESVLPLLQKAIEVNKMMAAQKEIQLNLQFPNQDCLIFVDAHRLMQVLSNFLSNAIKFSPQGSSVVLCLSIDGQQARIAVIDKGPGIAANFYDKIFQRFSQADASDSRAIGGTGLGLAISKELVNAMHGDIGFESVEGNGAEFYCCFPLIKA
ncbi:ATP-binding protein [Arsukibacterium sp.]|uniref:ATP-binding protein n=1 Tax=Arsukibacterium sp. TaxID=1977258 RepID=UPI002FD88B26